MSSLNDTPSADRLHIAFFGVCSAGKSSLMNAVAGHRVSIVAELPGTTTDAVRKAMELGELGPVVLIDTAGLDDKSVLGDERRLATQRVLNEADIAVIVIAADELNADERALVENLKRRGVAFLIVRNKIDLLAENKNNRPEFLCISATTGEGIDALKLKLIELGKSLKLKSEGVLIADKLKSGDFVTLVMPQDGSAPLKRLILPQQQVTRELLDAHCCVISCQVEELSSALAKVTPDLVITDSRVFNQVAAITPDNIKLTSFSIIFAREKGDLQVFLDGVRALKNLRDGDKVLIAEGCVHHRQCGDIGRDVIPNLLRKRLGLNLNFVFASGRDFPDDLSGVALVVHCGGCMLNRRTVMSRLEQARMVGVGIVNYGVLLANFAGVLGHAMEPFELRVNS